MNTRGRQRRIGRGLLGILLCVMIVCSSAPVTLAAVFSPFSWPLTSLGQSVGRIMLAGDIEYTSVYLDGNALFQIASQEILPSGTEANGDISPVRRRAGRIARTLTNIANSGFDPQTLEVTTATLNNQTVLVTSDGRNLSRQVILTVTEIDALLESTSIEDLARQWSQIIRGALIEAWQSRQPAARRQQWVITSVIGVGLLLISGLFLRVQRSLKIRFTELRKSSHRQPSRVSEAQSLMPIPLDRSSPTVTDDFRQQADLQQQLTLTILYKRLALIGLILFWFAGVTTILYIFPETRLEGRHLLRIPLRLFTIWLVLLVSSNLVILYINHRLREWVEEGVVFSDNPRRRSLRAPTLLEVSRGIIAFVSICIGILWFLVWTGFSPSSFLTGAGIVGVLMTFLFQSLLKDWLNGFLIVLEDQYAVGDMIQFEERLGMVEYMSLRATQLRAFDGRSITIPHNQMITAHNLSRDWSRVYFTIEVAYKTDPDVAIELMRQTAIDMANDPAWKEDIIDPVQIIGVSRVAHSGLELMLLMVVQRLRQLDIDREYRRRLKLVFDRQGIQIGIPQQNLRFSEN
jgi:moderate conductance mechanosensitive channel